MHEHTPLTRAQQKALMGPLNGARVQQRKQGGASLSYLEAWDVRATLIRVFGFGGFSAETTSAEILRIEDRVPRAIWDKGKKVGEHEIEFHDDGEVKFGSANFRVTAMASVRLTIHSLGAVYSEYAVSSQTGPDIGEVADFAVKTAESDALKRCAINLGTQFGLGLYDSGSHAEVVRRIFAPGQEWPMADAAVPAVGTAENPARTVEEAQQMLERAFQGPMQEVPADGA